jgi:aminoglycoside phosphotransferase
MRNRFKGIVACEQSLPELFRGSAEGFARFGREAIGNSIVHKFFNGGSDAITALVEVDGQLRIRKFASNGAAEKLKTQASWLCSHHGSNLPLVEVIERRETTSSYSYDMPMVTPTNDFYDVIHTSAFAQSRAMVTSVLDCVQEFHRLNASQEADAAAIDAYLDMKAIRNSELIESFVRRTIVSSQIDAEPHLFSHWQLLRDLDWLRAQVRDKRSAVIHGDLTIENIIIAPNNPLGFYLIDPNPENLFNTPLIDWGKLMQSLHLGYEKLNRGLSCDVMNGVDVSSVRSHAYAELHGMLETELSTRLGTDALREVYFHEILNYLRLTTYKIRQAPMRGLGFFSCTNILLERYLERWG